MADMTTQKNSEEKSADLEKDGLLWFWIFVPFALFALWCIYDTEKKVERDDELTRITNSDLREAREGDRVEMKEKFPLFADKGDAWMYFSYVLNDKDAKAEKLLKEKKIARKAVVVPEGVWMEVVSVHKIGTAPNYISVLIEVEYKGKRWWVTWRALNYAEDYWGQIDGEEIKMNVKG